MSQFPQGLHAVMGCGQAANKEDFSAEMIFSGCNFSQSFCYIISCEMRRYYSLIVVTCSVVFSVAVKKA